MQMLYPLKYIRGNGFNILNGDNGKGFDLMAESSMLAAGGHPEPSMKEPPYPPDEPPIEEPDTPPKGPFPPPHPPVEEPPDAPRKSPVGDPPIDDPNRTPIHRS